MKGFSLDLINAVCEEAGRNCEIQYDLDINCFAHDGRHFLLGEGLISKQYDACMSWYKTKDRTHVAAFSEPYWKINNIYHLYVPSDNPNDFDPNNIAGKKIGFKNGWTGGHTCLEDVGGADTMTHEYVIQMKDLFNKLGKGELDAVFVLDGFAKYYLKNGFQKIGEGIKCAEPGIFHAVARKDNDVTDWFSETLREMKTNGKYYALCNKAKQDHGSKGPINCVVEGEEVNEFAKIKCGDGCWV
ncbi:arginine-binding extracellular protein ArtP-like [Saccoglossus kowalevskii]